MVFKIKLLNLKTLVMLVLTTGIFFSHAQGQESLMMHGKTYETHKAFFNESHHAKVYAQDSKLSIEEVNAVAHEVLAFNALKPNSKILYLEIVGPKIVAKGLISKNEMKAIVDIEKALSKNQINIAWSKIKDFYLASSDRKGSSIANSVCNQWDQNARDLGFDGMLDYINAFPPLNEISLNDLPGMGPSDLPDFSANPFGGSPILNESYGTYSQKENEFLAAAGPQMATGGGDSSDDDEGISDETVVAAVGGAHIAATTASGAIIGTVIGLAAGPGGAPVGAALGASVGAAIGAVDVAVVLVAAWSTQRGFMDPCAPNSPTSCIPGIAYRK